jgi:mycothiol synthase
VDHVPQPLIARAATLDDIEPVSQLWWAADEAIGASPDTSVDFLRWLWRLSYVDLERDSCVVLEPGGVLAAFVFAWRDPAKEGPLTWVGRVGHEFSDTGLEEGLASWTADLATRRMASEGAFDLRTSVALEDRAAHRLLESRGYRHVRDVWDMGSELMGDETAGDPPDGVSIRRFAPGDERAWWEVHESAFAGHWGMVPTPYASFAAEWFEDADWDPSRVLLAEVGGEMVGESSWVANGPGRGYVSSLGVLQEARRRGVGNALLRAAIADIASRGLRDVELSVDTENASGAVGVYERVGLLVRREAHIFEKKPT